MNSESIKQNQHPFPLWKGFVFGLATPMFVKVFHLWISAPLSWGISVFLAFVLFYETPPRFDRPPNLLKTLLWSAAAGGVALIFAKIG